MLTAKAQYSLSNAEKYFSEHLSTGDYYTEGKQAFGEWFGKGSQRLKLSGPVNLDDFVKLCRNLDPQTDDLLTQRRMTNRRVFYDFTISPPKSVSIVALAGNDKRIEASHNRAVMVAMQELEKFAAARVRKNRASGYRNTGNVVGAVFRHDTSRALDPHLHCHCIIFNATRDGVEGCWKALETYEMLRAAKYAENIYYHELARDLKGFGYEIENHPRGDFEIKGMSKEMIRRFSKRHNEIDEKTRELLAQEPAKAGLNVKDIREHIAHKERARKIKNVGREKLTSLWNGQLSLAERITLGEFPSPERRRGKSPCDLNAVVSWSEEHLFDRRSVVREHELWRFALERGRGEDFMLQDLHGATKERDYIRDDERWDKLTKHEILAREWDIVCQAKEGVGRFKPFATEHRIRNAALDSEQVRAVQRILASRDFITLFRGGAGTGKSYALGEVRTCLLRAGLSVQAIAPQRQQVMDLEDKGFHGTQTISEFLTKRRMPRKSVVIVDEAGQIGAKQMQELLKFIQQNDGRLILSGDTRQHGAVEASDALWAIEEYSGLEAIELSKIQRQNPKHGRTAQEKIAIRKYRQAVRMASEGDLAASFDQLNHNRGIVQCGLLEQQEFLAKEYLELASRNCATVIVSQTWSEIHKVNEQVRLGLKEKGLIENQDVTVVALENVDLTDAQKRDARHYTDKTIVIANRDVAGLKKGSSGRLVDITVNHLEIESGNQIKRVPFRYLNRISVCQEKELALAPGDRLQLKTNAKTRDGRRVANGELVTVKAIKSDGSLQLNDGRTLQADYRQFVRGYAVTSYAAQGKNADYVLFSDSAIRAATNQKQWYVTISRGKKGIKIFTNDKRELRENVVRSGERELAIHLSKGKSPCSPTYRESLRERWLRRQKSIRRTLEREQRNQVPVRRQVEKIPPTQTNRRGGGFRV
jgi:conjugative relaxase-like TrwC/TraI family protein